MRILALSSLLAALLVAAPALADIPPDPNSADAHCTPAEQCPTGITCPYAFHPGKPPAPGEVPVGQQCRNDATAKGLEQRCRNGGNYGGQHLYCPKGATGSWKAPGAPGKSSGCATRPGPAGGGLALLVAAGLVLAARRRAR